jgi:hypothetical protein
MLNKRDICEEIGNYFGIFYEDIGGFLIIDVGDKEYSYRDEDELLRNWLPKLQEDDIETGEGTWSEIIEYIQSEID